MHPLGAPTRPYSFNNSCTVADCVAFNAADATKTLHSYICARAVSATGGAVPILIDGSAVLLGSVGFVRNYNPKWAGGIWAKNGAEVTASRCAWDNNGSPEAMPYVRASG